MANNASLNKPLFDRVTIVGLGLIGGSLALALRKAGLVGELVGCSRSPRTLEKGLALGVVDRVESEPALAVRGADLVFVAVPVSAMAKVFKAMEKGLNKDVIITDGGSTKGSALDAARKGLGNDWIPRFVPGHPIAGAEHSGVEAARDDLYERHRVILTPLKYTDAGALAKVTAMWEAVGAEVLSMNPSEHDRVLAETSHLPHLLAFSLVDTLARQGDSLDIFRYAAGGFRDFTRIASSDPVMWHDIFRENQNSVLSALDLFEQGLADFRAAIVGGDSDAMMGIMTRANSARAHFLAMNARTSYTRALDAGDESSMSSTTAADSRNSQFVCAPGGATLGQGLQGAVRVPGDKSISHRSIMLGALANGVTRIEGFLEGEDALATLQAFRDMGVLIEGPHNGRVTVHGVGLNGLKAPSRSLYMGNSGTSMRLLMGLLAGQKFSVELTGDESLTKRPMERVAKPLREMGAVIETVGGPDKKGTPPVNITGGQALKGIHYDLPMASAQVKSAILLAGLYAEGETSVTEPAPTRDHTERMLTGFGCQVQRDGATSKVKGGQSLTGTSLEVPADISSAAFFLVGASISPGSDLLLPHVGINPTRTGVIDILKLMGADITIENQRDAGGEPVADLRVKYAPLKGITIPEELVPLAIDEFPAIFIAAANAQGETILHGAEELRVKESDRIQVMADGLTALGIENEVYDDGIRIVGGSYHGGEIVSHGDHRIAMSFAMASLRATGEIRIHDCANVATSFPGFASLAAGAGLALVEEQDKEQA